jgi:hypothetical protein
MKSLTLKGSSFNSQMPNQSQQELPKTSSILSLENRPILLESDKKDEILIDTNFEINLSALFPLKRLILKSESLKAFYHAITVNNIVYFFRSSETRQKKK